MEIDTAPVAHRTRSSAKRARSPSSPTQYDRPSKRVASRACHDMSIPLPYAPFHPTTRLRSRSEDWVSQTQEMRLESPSISHGSGFSTPVNHGGTEVEVRIDEAMVDQPMHNDQRGLSVSHQPDSPQLFQVQYLRLPEHRPPATPPPYHDPNQLQIPSIQVQAATPSPTQMFPPHSFNTTFTSSSPSADSPFAPCGSFTPQSEETRGQADQAQAPVPTRKQRFTMGPRADCELCRTRVKGHYMHFD